jgi:hypothetical protein
MTEIKKVTKGGKVMNKTLMKRASRRIFNKSVSLMLLLSILYGSFLGTSQAANTANAANKYTLAAWQFTNVATDDSFSSTHGVFGGSAHIFALTDRLMTTSKVSVDGSAFLGTIYCGDWGSRGDRWRIKTPTAGYENILLSFASYGVSGAPRSFRVETDAGEVLARFTSGTANTAGAFTRVNISLPESCNNRQDLMIDIIQEDNTSVGGGTVQPGNRSNSRLGDIFISGDKIEEENQGSVIAAWQFTNVATDDSFSSTHGVFGGSAHIFALTDRLMTTSKVSVDGSAFLGTIYCGDWGSRGDRWRIKTPTAGYENILLSFASYGVSGAPRSFRVETDAGEVLARFTSGTANTAGAFTRVNISLPESCNNRQDLMIDIIQEDNTSVGGGTVQPGNASNSRLGDIVISGVKLSA